MLSPALVLCLGNEIVADDGFGAVVAARLREALGKRVDVEVVFAARAGFFLLDLLARRDRALIVDTIQTGRRAPGSLSFLPSGVFAPSRHLTSSHQISLPTALELARRLELPMPRRIDVLVVEAADLETLSEELTAPVAAAVDPAVELVSNWINRQEFEYADLEDGTTARA